MKKKLEQSEKGGTKKEYVYQVSSERARFLTKVQPVMLTELERDTFQPLPRTMIPSAVSSFNRKVAIRSRYLLILKGLPEF